MDFKSYLEDSANQINQEIDRILIEWLNGVKKVSPKLIPFAVAFINACKGGKRIRGMLCQLGYEIAQKLYSSSTTKVGTQNDRIKLGAAIEILHTAILIHDDIIDKSLTRRGQPSVYKALGGDHYGVSQAIILGDIGLYLAVKLIASLSFPYEYKIIALKHLAETIISTGWGEILDVELPNWKERSAVEMVLLYSLKTAKYTISGPLIMGAILGGADKKLITTLTEFGENAGIAFQIQDDILDGEADDSFRAETLEYVSRAKKLIPKITDDKIMAKILEEMLVYLVERTK